MAKEKLTKTCTIRTSERDYDYMISMSADGSINQGVVACSRVLGALEGQALYELREKFTPGEWKYMATMMKNIPLTEERKVQITELNRLITDPRGLIALKSRFKVDPYKMTDVMHTLNGIHAFAITRRIERFWQSVDGLSDYDEEFDAWAQY